MAQASVSTHVLDTTSGKPASGLRVELHREGETVGRGVTDHEGRIRELAAGIEPGVYRLVFETRAYAADAFFVRVALDVRLEEGHTHVPLLVSRYGVTSYRGT